MNTIFKYIIIIIFSYVLPNSLHAGTLTITGSDQITAHETFRDTVTITGSDQICEGDSALLTVTFSGDSLIPPYSVTIDEPGDTLDPDLTFSNITSDTLQIYVKKSGSYEIKSATEDGGNSNLEIGLPDRATILYFDPVSAATSGSTAICPGVNTNIPVLLNGDLPINLHYTINNTDTFAITDIDTSNYSLTASQPGTYKLIQVMDGNGCISNVTTQNIYTINALSEPSALIVGNATICRNSSVPVTVLLEGESPWSITYSRNGAPDGTIDNITQTPFSFPVNRDGVYQIEEVADNNCIGEGSGSAVIDYYPETSVDIIGLSSTYSLNSPPVDLSGNPAGGAFTGPGVVSSDNKFYPNLAGVEGSPHEIVYAYVNPDNNCTSYDTALVSVIDSVASIFIIDEKQVYCFNDDPITVIGSNIENQTGSFSIEGGEGLTDNFDNTATVDPTVLRNGEFVITYTFFDGESNFSIEKTITVEFIERLVFIGFDDNSNCKNGNPVELEGNNPNGIFSGGGVTGNIVEGFTFDPTLANIGLDSIIYSFTSTNGCVRDTFEQVTIYDIPQIDFTVSDSCVSEAHPSPIQFINTTESVDPVVQWNWNFNDNSSGQDNFSTLKNPTHLYSASGPRNVSLSAVTNRGCSNTKSMNITFGDKPLADFTFETECFVSDSAIRFTDASISKAAIDGYSWKFNDNGSTTISNEQNPEYVFSSRSNYKVELIVSTEFGCTDTSEKEIFLRPTFNLADGPYFQDFGIDRGSWVANKKSDSEINSWQFGPVEDSFFEGSAPSNLAWYTNIVVRDQEQSWITSPCFNFEEVEKPYIKFDIWRAFEQNRDGAVMQSTTNNGKTWTNIGSINDGINWYNSFEIQGSPGGQAIGWSNRTDNNWIEARHRLDSLVEKRNVQFRVAYGSDGTGINNEGFAFDNIWISTRTKKVLVEHFTNVGDSLHNASNELVRELNQLNPRDMIEIQYHLPAPGIDSFNLANPGGPNIRMIKYGLSGGPISIVNGNTTYQYSNEEDIPKNIDLITRSLTDAVFDISLTTSVENDILRIESQTKAIENIESQEFSLKLAVIQDIAYHMVENERKTYYNVFLEFIPDAAGITYLGGWSKNDVRIEEFQYTIDDDLNPENLSVIAFIQSENTNEILQVETDQDSLTTGTIQPGFNNLAFNVFPNPSDGHVNIMLHSHIDEPLEIEILDYTGKILFKKPLHQYENMHNISVSFLPKGMYLIRIAGKRISGAKRIVIY